MRGGQRPKGYVVFSRVWERKPKEGVTSLRRCQQRYQRRRQLIMYRATLSARVVDNVEDARKRRTRTRYKCGMKKFVILFGAKQ